MRAIWKGAVSFGLVSIPIKVLGATENHSVSFHQIHAQDGGRIRYRKVCELEDKEVPSEEITKAFSAADGTPVALSDDDLALLPLPTAKTIEILAFVPGNSIDPLQLDRSYYLAADGVGAAKPYVLLREALVRSEKVAVAKLALRGRETLAMLRVVGDSLAMHTMLWPDEIRPAAGIAPDTKVTVRDVELDLADTLMAALGELDLETLHDEYREAVEALVTAKLEGIEPADTGEEPSGGKVLDLMAALESSVRAAQGQGGGTGEGAGGAAVTELPSRTTRAGKKAAAKKTTAASGGSGSGSGSGSAGGSGSGSAGTGRAPAKKAAAKKATGKTSAKTSGTRAASGSAAKKTTGATSGSSRKAGGKETAAGAAKKTTKKAAAKKTSSSSSSSKRGGRASA